MAKRKHSRALFEVIKQTQEAQSRRSTTTLRPVERKENPIFAWFKRRSQPKRMTLPPVDPVMREVPEEIDPTNVPVQTRRFSRDLHGDVPEETFVKDDSSTVEGQEDMAHAQADASRAEYAQEESTAADQVFADTMPTQAEESSVEHVFASQPVSSHDTAHAMTPPDESADVEEPVTAAAPKLRSSGRQVHLVLSYPSIAVASIAGLLLLTVAFLAGRQTARPFAYTGPTLSQLQAQKPSPDVMNLNAGETTATLSSNKEAAPPTMLANTQEKTAPAQPSNAAIEPAADRRRVVGRNYIIAQSYPDEDNANKAAEVLRKNNIPVSIEQIDAAPGWYCVVSEVGFDRVKTDECERYQKLIKDANAQAKAARLKAFEPWLYKWK